MIIMIHRENRLFNFKHKYYNLQWELHSPKQWKLYATFNLNLRLDDNGFKFSFYFFNLISIDIKWTQKEDHAGIEISVLSFLGHLINQIYDNRHWNDEQNRWMNDSDYAPKVKTRKKK